MRTAIIILNWNGKELLKEFLPSVCQHSQEAEIFIIDNASTDDSLKWTNEKYPQISIVPLDQNYGFAKGYNLGIEKILKEHPFELICLLNSDVKVSPNWLTPVRELFEKNKEIAAVQPKILDYKRPEYFEYAGAAGGFIDNLGYPYCRGRVFWTLEKDEGQYDDVKAIFWASGACFFIRTKDFVQQKGFDESYFAHMEEIDLCWRLHNQNRKVYYCGKSSVYHLGGGTLKNNSPRKTYLNFRNSLATLAKNLPPYWGFPLIFVRLCLDGLTGIVFLYYEGWKHGWAIVKSHFGFYKRLGNYLKQRNKTNKKYYQKKWVPLQYFLAKRKYYKDLK